jgi:CDP-6-deoxy-D-xylo-4-hexulose-3-dehydrase
MVRESTDEHIKEQYTNENPKLNPDFIFAFPAYNVRPTEITGILGLSQLNRLDANVVRRTENFGRFLGRIDNSKYRTNFKLEGSSNYAFNLVLKEADDELVERLTTKMRSCDIEFRKGSAGGGNQLRQPYLQGLIPERHHLEFPETEHIHFYGFYIGNFPDLSFSDVDELCVLLNSA